MIGCVRGVFWREVSKLVDGVLFHQLPFCVSHQTSVVRVSPSLSQGAEDLFNLKIYSACPAACWAPSFLLSLSNCLCLFITWSRKLSLLLPVTSLLSNVIDALKTRLKELYLLSKYAGITAFEKYWFKTKIDSVCCLAKSVYDGVSSPLSFCTIGSVPYANIAVYWLDMYLSSC